METGASDEEFITIVPVGDNKPAAQDSAFVTVLTVGAAAGAAKVVVCRPRGARLGLGLKFEGGSAAAERVRRLLVQSCAEDSPAAKASTPWGKLIPGDEILAIDGVTVSNLTRIECVRRLKDSDESLELLVRHFEAEKQPEQNSMDFKENVIDNKQSSEITRPSTLPPPVPPRKLGKKNSFKEKSILQTLGEQNTLGNIDASKEAENVKDTLHSSVIPMINKLSRKSSFDSHIHRQKESIAYLRKGSPEEVRRLVRRLSDGKAIPPDAEVYLDLLSNEWERCLVLADAESDDTGSSISTVVDRLGSMANSVENSIPSTPIMQPKSIDIQKVLNSIENIDSDLLKDMTRAKLLEISDESRKNDRKLSDNGLKNHEIEIQNALVTENTIAKKVEKNDKNNNHTQILKRNTETNDSTKINDKTSKQESVSEKPKPMPRNTKVERSASEKKRRPIPIPELLSPPLSEPLLTPTKKTCIETWLQRSEIEMNSKTEDKLEDNSVPEILPRLIDFVPKTQYKDSSGSESPPSTCTRPTTAPPPPPVETREDGSGASLDTIGELDESSDVTDNVKPATDNETNKRKSLYERNFWDDRVSKSDAEDKSLSNDETPLPSCPRQPPDGVETPTDAIEKTPDLPTRLPPRLSTGTGWNSTRPRFSYLSRTQDARSEASVKDKIAMFSVDLATSSDRLDTCGTLPIRSHSTLRKSSTPYTSNYTEVSSLDRRLTKSQDNLDETPRSFKRNVDRPEVLGAIENSITEKNIKRFIQPEISSKPLFYGSTTTLPSDATFTRPAYHVRSISDDNSNKNVSTHKSNLEYLIEQRKKSMSKLRGLVIPEVQAPIVDLPEIKVLDSLSKPFLYNSPNKDIKKESNLSHSKSITLSENKWKNNFIPNNIPKYSPAFKRKSLQVYSPSSLSKESTPERKLVEKIDTNNRNNNYSNASALKPVRNSFEFSKSSLTKSGSLLNRDYYKSHANGNTQDFKNVEIKICTTTDIVDSDNDSAMSSTQSSYRSSASSPMHTIENIESDSSRLSPRISHYNTYKLIKSEIPNKCTTEKNFEDYNKRKICRSMSSDTNISLSSSAGSAATSGSQASCSSLESSVADSDKRKVSKVYNVDTINRRNIVASAKCRSGRDVKLKSPVVETKFSHESLNRSPSPTNKSSDRLSTLTTSVSAITKGENRRRNKIIVDSDSDSDSEVNIRQRKSDFKNTRLKRNSSLSNKSKQNEMNQDVEKVAETLKHTKVEISNEINEGCLEYSDSIKTVMLQKKNSFSSNQSKKEVQKIEKLEENRKGTPLNETKELNTPTIIIKAKSSSSITTRNSNINKQQINTKKRDLCKISTQIFRLIKGAGTGVGLILAGGVDCEAKDVTVHRVFEDGIAAKAGIKRGSKITSINGIAMLGLTHAQSVTILKEQRSEVIIEIEHEVQQNGNRKAYGSEHAESNGDQTDVANRKETDKNDRSVVTVMLEKAGGGAGLGFGLDGGRDSPQGDRPLTIKKLFAGGAAAQSGRIVVGAELISAGGQSMEGFTRTQAWAALKALPAGRVALVLRNPSSSN
ncbi:probable serine/threonine-protein kinase nek3 [Maniola hyperantus]|uniref:probable serine/threonine-protein kinase nek3 n=1 Tax=Aphantopus hyperantus TaxID=2795564 RepID=UPI0015690243|nr:uncharacterized protein LOC117992663 [Maniola hyperantus]XP_034836274.1 uncharacterized protein LOC117992663 [Maniola hyperantus]